MSGVGLYVTAVVSATIGFAAAAVLASGRDADHTPCRCYNCRHYCEHDGSLYCMRFALDATEFGITPLGYCAWWEKEDGDS